MSWLRGYAVARSSFETYPDQTLVRQTLAAMERSGLLATNSFLYRVLLNKVTEESGRE
jgi:hypothetical protein